MSETFDILFSYRRSDLARAQPLLDAMNEVGLRVWRDEAHLPDNASITQEIRRSMAASKALLAFYSVAYPRSRACQQEIIAAWLAAQQMREQPFERVLVINPERSFDHLPKVLCQQQLMGWAEGPPGFFDIAEKILDHVNRLEGTLSGVALPTTTAYYGMAPVEAVRFVGRVRELWDLHGQLTANRMSIITGTFGQASAQLRGMGGNGKSLLAREYAIRFGGAYPGGVFWLNAYGNDDTKGPLSSEARNALRQDQFRDFAVHLGVRLENRTPEQIESAFWRCIEEKGKPCLWIVDDLPSGLARDEIENCWTARWAGASSLITTRSTEYGSLGAHVDLDVLTESEALELLIAHREPQARSEEEDAKQIVAQLGYHPLAIEVAGSFLAIGTQSFRDYLNELSKPDCDAVEFGAWLQERLPTGHERSISSTLLKSIHLLGEEGTDFLRLASVLAVAPIPVRLVEAAFEHARFLPRAWLRVIDMLEMTLFKRSRFRNRRRMRVVRALDQAGSLSLCQMAGNDARTVHTLVSRTVRYSAPNDRWTTWLKASAARALSELLEVGDDVRRHPQLAREIVHARHLISGGINNHAEAFLGHWVGRYDYVRGDYRSARRTQEEVVKAFRRLQGNRHRNTLAAIGNLAGTLVAMGESTTARDLLEQVWEIHRRLRGEKHLGTVSAMNNLAGTLMKMGDLATARKLQEKVLETRRAVLGDEHPDTLRASNTLAAIMAKQGDLEGARKLQERVLEAGRRQGFGDEHPDTLRVKNNLADTLAALGEVSAAQELQEDVVQARSRVLGKEHSDTTTAAWNLVRILVRSNEASAAKKVVSEHLLWLLERNPGTLTADQLEIRKALLTMFDQ